MKIIIAGLGLMGASLALALRRNRPDYTVIGYDKPQILEEALENNIIQESVKSWPGDCHNADLIFLATPLKVIKEHLCQLSLVINKNTVVTDVGSTKAELAGYIEEINFSGVYVGGHPMTGAEKSGLKAANPLLYENAIYILTNVLPENEEFIRKKLYPALEAVKARTLLLDAQLHDKIMSVISHLPQLIAITLVNLVGQKNDENFPYFDLAAGGFRDLTRIASSSIEMWEDIFTSNQENIKKAVTDFIGLLHDLELNLDDLSLEFDKANRFRQQVPKTNKGFLSPLTDVLVYVADQVGVISKISNALASKRIDIRDIELLKIREKEGGVFRMSFANTEEAAEAVRVLNSINYQAFIRE